MVIASVFVVAWFKFRPTSFNAIEQTSSLSHFKDHADVNRITIKNSVYHPYTILNGKKEDLYDQKSIIILEESESHYHPSVGWNIQSLALSAWEHEFGADLKPMWKVSAKANLSVSWSLDTDIGVLTVGSSNDSDGSDSNTERYDAITGDAIETHKQQLTEQDVAPDG